jgi:hypothetical protein
MRTVISMATAGLLLVVLSGCSTFGGGENVDGGAVTYHVGMIRSGDAAALSGVLVFENGCVRLENGTIPLFPDDETSWDGETLTLRGVDYELGDTIEVGGGETNRDTTSADVPERCGDGPLFVVAPGR